MLAPFGNGASAAAAHGPVCVIPERARLGARRGERHAGPAPHVPVLRPVVHAVVTGFHVRVLTCGHVSPCGVSGTSVLYVASARVRGLALALVVAMLLTEPDRHPTRPRLVEGSIDFTVAVVAIPPMGLARTLATIHAQRLAADHFPSSLGLGGRRRARMGFSTVS